jgi:hypothetical protein
MTIERYPAELKLGLDDLAGCGWREILLGISHERYSAMWEAFSKAARSAIEEGRINHGKALWLLGDACSMMLRAESPNDPFKPFSVIQGKRSPIPDDFTEADIAFFSEVVTAVDDAWLKARLADLVWLIRKPRQVYFALLAIDAYRSIPLDAETWFDDGAECWQRAIALTQMLKRAAGDRLKEIEVAMRTVFHAATIKDGHFALGLSDILLGSGLAHEDAGNIANKLNILAAEFEAKNELNQACDYYEATSKWFKEAGDKIKSAEATVRLAEGWVKVAIARQSASQPSNMVAAHFFEKAIQIYRSIPRTERAVHKVDERIAEISTRLNEASRESLDEMSEIKSPGIDISQFVENTRDAVRGKTVIEAFKIFINMRHGESVNKLRNRAIKHFQDHPLLAMATTIMMSRDGRVIDKSPSNRSDATPTGVDEMAIHTEMIRNYSMSIGIFVKTNIWPALEILLLEHRLHEADFIHLASQSPIVPLGRERLFGKALFEGYELDFITALHVVIPQIEHMVRYQLKQVGVKTTTLNQDGIVTENSLNALMEMPEATRIFGEDLAFEIKSLFCDTVGPNLRNEFAHGLLDDQACQSLHSVYAWWLCLKIIFISHWSAQKKPSAAPREGEAHG